MATIPEVRDRLTEIIERMRKSSDMAMVFAAEEVEQCVRDLYRRKAFRVAPVKAPAITAEIRLGVRAMAKANPTMSLAEIGHKFNINSGRVSEILRGKRR